MIELRRLHAFVVTVEEGPVTRAAERLGMQPPTQPTTAGAGGPAWIPSAAPSASRRGTDLDEAGTAELVDSVLAGQLDAAFVRSPVGAVTGLRVEPLLEEPMLAALPLGHRLAAPAKAWPLPLMELADWSLVDGHVLVLGTGC